jgi:acyl dehydratase
MSAAYRNRGLYFEEFNDGDEFVTRGRTITEADIVAFAGLSGDFNEIHTDAVAASADSFGQRVAHGLLIQSIASGLAVMSGLIEGTVLAFRELTVKFSEPVFIGDTIHVTLAITGKKAFSRLNAGNIYMKVNVINQEGKTVQKGEWIMLVKMKEKGT